MYHIGNCMRAALVLVQLAAFSVLPLTGAYAAAGTEIKVDTPWSRATPGMAKVGAGYATIKNMSAKADWLVSVKTDVSEMAEIHEMKMDNGVMKMRRLPDGLPIPANGEVVLKPGSYHLMLMGLKEPLKEGEHFSGTLTFENAGEIEVVFAVKAIGAPGP